MGRRNQEEKMSVHLNDQSQHSCFPDVIMVLEDIMAKGYFKEHSKAVVGVFMRNCPKCEMQPRRKYKR